MSRADVTFETRLRWLSAMCWFFAGLGLALALLGRTGVFGMWTTAAATALFGQPELPPVVERFAAATDAILGGSIAGKWLAAGWIVRVPLARRQQWAADALLLGLVGWFAIDSAVSLRVGAHFNVWMINLFPLAAVGGLLASVRRQTGAAQEPTGTPSRAWSALRWSCWAFAAFGVVVAFFPRTFLFEPYNAALARAYAPGPAGEAQLALWESFVMGPIGGTFAAHFAMLALALSHAKGERWVLHATWSSVLLWFTLDTVGCLMRGAAFNVLLVNLPSAGWILLLTLLAWRKARPKAA
jgi:hypothetical protein